MKKPPKETNDIPLAKEGFFSYYFWKKTEPLFAQTALWVVLGNAVYLSFFASYYYIFQEKQDLISILGFLPNSILQNHSLFLLCRYLFGICAFFWFFQVGLPYSSWGATIFFTVQICLFQENINNVDHIFHMTNMVLILFGFWYHFYHKEIKEAVRENKFWESKVCPGWLHYLITFYICFFFTLTGIMKLANGGGLQWANGTSLQIWFHLWGDQEFFITQLILNNKDLALYSQLFVLIAETLAIIGIFHRYLRYGIGFLVLSFHIVNEIVFHFNFHCNAILVIVFLLPTKEVLFFSKKAYQNRQEAKKKERKLPTSKVKQFLISRFDLFGKYSR